jgi:predicted ester cyclase
MSTEDNKTKPVFMLLHSAFPDLQIEIEDLIAEGDKVVGRVTARGTHQGAFMGIAPTGKPVSFNAIDVVRIAGGKIVERWSQADNLALLQQLGGGSGPG